MTEKNKKGRTIVGLLAITLAVILVAGLGLVPTSAAGQHHASLDEKRF